MAELNTCPFCWCKHRGEDRYCTKPDCRKRADEGNAPAPARTGRPASLPPVVPASNGPSCGHCGSPVDPGRDYCDRKCSNAAFRQRKAQANQPTVKD